jgi:hypothetical protein
MQTDDLARELSRLVTALLPDDYVLARIDADTGYLEAVPVSVPADGTPSDVDLRDDLEVSLASALRVGMFGNVSYTSVQAKLLCSRSQFPEIAPKFRASGSQTLYRVGDLRKWWADYAVKVSQVRSTVSRRANASYRRKIEATASKEPGDALGVLLGKIRGEDVE